MPKRHLRWSTEQGWHTQEPDSGGNPNASDESTMVSSRGGRHVRPPGELRASLSLHAPRSGIAEPKRVPTLACSECRRATERICPYSSLVTPQVYTRRLACSHQDLVPC